MEDILSLVRFPSFHPSVQAHVVDLGQRLATRGYASIAGRHRITFIAPCKRMVVKLPHCEMGMHANEAEARSWRQFVRDPRHIPVAACRIFHDDPEVGVPILIMRHVDISPEGPAPQWADWIDCAQYGRDRHGRLVAYDL